MANCYFKIIRGEIAEILTDDIVFDLKQDSSNIAKFFSENIYDFANNIKSAKSADVSTLLKYYAINQLLKSSSCIQKNNTNLRKTQLNTVK